MHSKQQQIEILFHMLKKKQHIQKLNMWNEKNAFHFLCTPKWRVRGYIAPPKIWMYAQMKKFVGML
jgi:hypothetical protein